jgi:hypothetical protein
LIFEAVREIRAAFFPDAVWGTSSHQNALAKRSGEKHTEASMTKVTARKVDEAPPTTFEEFWPRYLQAHRKPETRALHMLGTTIGILGIAAWLKTGRKSYFATGVAGSYGSAWLGHFAFEGNEPAAFENPLWSLEGDLRMYKLWLTGELDAEIERVLGAKRA